MKGLKNITAHLRHPHLENFQQPLLSKQEIDELRQRMLTRPGLTPSKNTIDTAHPRLGDRRSTYRGYGLDYEESRAYQPGDDRRYMNWPLTARSGKLSIKVFRAERSPGVFILLDRRATMLFGTRTRLKVSQAARVATCLAFDALTQHASLSGVILDADSPTPLWTSRTGAGRSGESATHDFIHTATAPCLPTSSLAQMPHPSSKKFNEATAHEAADEHRQIDFGYLLSMLQTTLTPGSTLYLISDFIDLREQHRGKLLQLAAENQLHAIHIFDPAERHLPHAGKIRFVETGDTADAPTDTNSAAVQKAYAAAARKHFTARKQLFHSLNIHYTALSTVTERIENELPGL